MGHLPPVTTLYKAFVMPRTQRLLLRRAAVAFEKHRCGLAFTRWTKASYKERHSVDALAKIGLVCIHEAEPEHEAERGRLTFCLRLQRRLVGQELMLATARFAPVPGQTGQFATEYLYREPRQERWHAVVVPLGNQAATTRAMHAHISGLWDWWSERTCTSARSEFRLLDLETYTTLRSALCLSLPDGLRRRQHQPAFGFPVCSPLPFPQAQ